MSTTSGLGSENGVDSIVLEEEIDPNYIPTESEVIEYAKWLGMDLNTDQDLFWVAREGLMAPLPKNWKPCKTKDTEDIYYFNFATGESTWDHPCDGYYKRLYEEEKKKKETAMKENSDSSRSRAKQDVEQLLGKTEKKKTKKLKGSSSLLDVPSLSSIPGALERKPLPGIIPKQSLVEPIVLGGIKSHSHDAQREISNRASHNTVSTMSNSQDYGDDTSFASQSKFNSNLPTRRSIGSIPQGLSSPDRHNNTSVVTEFKSLDEDGFYPLEGRHAASKVIESDEKMSSDQNSRNSNALSNCEHKVSKVNNIDVQSEHMYEDFERITFDLKNKLRQSNADLDFATKKCDRLQEQQAELEKRLSREKDMSNSLRGDYDQLESSSSRSMTEVKRELQLLKEDERRAVKENEELKAKVNELEYSTAIKVNNGYSAVERQLKLKIDLLEDQLQQSEKRVSNKSQDLDQVTFSLESAQREAKHLKEELAFEVSMREKLRKKCDDLENAMTVTVPTITATGGSDAAAFEDMTRTKTLLEAKLKTAEELLAVKRDECLKHMMSVQHLEGTISVLEQGSRGHAEQEAKLRTQLVDWQVKHRSLDTQYQGLLSTLSDTNASTSADAVSSRVNKRSYEDSAKLMADLEAERAESAAKDRKIAGYQEELIQLQRRQSIHQDTDSAVMNSLQQQIDDGATLLSNRDTELAALTAKIAQQEEAIAVWRNRCCSIQDEVDRPTSDAVTKELQDSFRTVGAKLASLHLEHDQLLHKYSAATDEINKYITDAMDLHTQIRVIELQSHKYQGQISIHQSTIEMYATEILQLKNTLQKERVDQQHAALEYENKLASLKRADSVAPALSRDLPMFTSPQTTAIPAAPAMESLHLGGLVELGIMVGKQQSIVSQLEEKLKAAETAITQLSNNGVAAHSTPATSNQQDVIPLDPGYSNPIKDNVIYDDNIDTEDGLVGEYTIMLRDLWSEIVRRKGRGEYTTGTKDSALRSKVYWSNKVAKEWKFIDDAKLLLKKEKGSLRAAQESLGRRKEAWKVHKQHLHSNDENGKQSLKGQSRLLNMQTMRINNAVEQTKRTQRWIDDRADKLEKMESLLIQQQRAGDDIYICDTLQDLSRELDQDLSKFSIDAVTVADIGYDDVVFSTEREEKERKLRNKVTSICGNFFTNDENVCEYGPDKWAYASASTSEAQRTANARSQALEVKQQIRQFSDQRCQSKDTYERHASWLDGLRQEIGRFSHENTNKLASKTQSGHRNILGNSIFNI